MLVLLLRNYEYPDLFRQTPGSKGKWGDMQFTSNEVKECDYVVVLNHPIKNIKVICRKGARILVVQEPPYEKNNFFKFHFRFYDTIISGFKKMNSFKILNTQAALPWHVNKTYDELSDLSLDKIIAKNDKVSFVTSNSNINPPHQLRLNFIEYMKAQAFDFALYGRGFQPLDDKFDGIYPYKYTIAAENFISNDYFTEKIIDAFLSWSMPVYYGCPNITDYFPAESMILVDLKNPKEALEKIKNAIENKLWDKNIDAIRQARELALNKYQLFPMLHDLIKNEPAYHSEKLEKTFLPYSGLTRVESIKKKIKIFFKIIIEDG
jgi:hypothetical protein